MWESISQFFVYNPDQPLLFNSQVFLVWFLTIYGIFQFVYRNVPFRITLLLSFSLFFYYKSSGIFFMLLILSTLANFYLGARIHSSERQSDRKIWLWLSIFFNLGLLGYYKYSNFILSSINSL